MMLARRSPILVGAVLFAATGCADSRESDPDDPPLDPYDPGTIDELDCQPDLDGTIRADQLEPAYDVPLDYRISPAGEERPIDLQSSVDSSGEAVWDLAEEYEPRDQVLEVVATELGEQWYADEFPEGEFSSVLDPALELDAVYSHDGSAVYLHGYASAEEDSSAGKTLVVYEEPIIAYDFPLEVGDAWSSSAEVRGGVVRDLPYAGTESYEFEIDQSGELWLPNITFENALRVRASVTIDPGLGDPIYREQVQFLFECFGEVARLVGPEKELNEDFAREDYEFDHTVEMRRLGF